MYALFVKHMAVLERYVAVTNEILRKSKKIEI